MIKSVDLVDDINYFRKRANELAQQNPNIKYKQRSKLLHKHLLDKIRNYNKEMELFGQPKIRPSFYMNSQNKKQPCFLLTEVQAHLFMAGESNIVQRYVEMRFEELKLENQMVKASILHTKSTHDKIKDIIIELNFNTNKYARFNKEINDLVGLKFSKTNLKKDDMDIRELEFRAEVEEAYVESLRKSKKHGGTKAKVKKLLFK